MKPFDLEKALAGEPVVTRGGMPVTDLHFFKSLDLMPVRAVLINSLESYTEEGGYYASGAESTKDLFMAEKPKVKKEGWVNFNPSLNKIYQTKEEAAAITTINTVQGKIEWEEES